VKIGRSSINRKTKMTSELSWDFLQSIPTLVDPSEKVSLGVMKKSSKAPYPPKESILRSSFMFDGWLSFPDSEKKDAFGFAPGGGFKRRTRSAIVTSRKNVRIGGPKRNAKRSLCKAASNGFSKRRKLMAKEEQVTPERKKNTALIFPSTPYTAMKTPRITEFFTPRTENISPLMVRTEPLRRRRVNLGFDTPLSTSKEEKSLSSFRLPTAAGLSVAWRQMKRNSTANSPYSDPIWSNSKANSTADSIYNKSSNGSFSMTLRKKKSLSRSIKRDDRRLSTKRVRWAVQSNSTKRICLDSLSIGEGIYQPTKKARRSGINDRYIKKLSPIKDLACTRKPLTPAIKRTPKRTASVKKRLSSRRKKSLLEPSPRTLHCERDKEEKAMSTASRSAKSSLRSLSKKKRLVFEE